MAHNKMMLVPLEMYQPLPTKQVEENQSLPTNQEDENGLGMDNILSGIPKNMRMRAQALLKQISADPEQRLQWNERGELVYHGKVIPGSQITDLLRDFQQQYKHGMSVGLREFRDGLKELNIPIALMEGRPGPPGERLVPHKKWFTV